MPVGAILNASLSNSELENEIRYTRFCAKNQRLAMKNQKTNFSGFDTASSYSDRRKFVQRGQAVWEGKLSRRNCEEFLVCWKRFSCMTNANLDSETCVAPSDGIALGIWKSEMVAGNFVWSIA